MNIIRIANQMDMSYDFYIRQNMQATERKLLAMINKSKSLIEKLSGNWRRPLIRKFEGYDR